jgi:hypothetical protein
MADFPGQMRGQWGQDEFGAPVWQMRAHIIVYATESATQKLGLEISRMG